MAFGTKTNERPGTRAQIRYLRVSAYKAREVLDLVRGKHVRDADEILGLVERDVARDIRKCLASAVANAANNDGQDPEALFVSACYADEGPTLKRWRPRARGRATRIRKRTCHITVIVSRLAEDDLRRRLERTAAARPTATGGRRTTAGQAASRRARVAKSRGPAESHDHETDHDHDHDHETEQATPAEAADVNEGLPDSELVADEAASATEPTEPVADEAASVDEPTGVDEPAEPAAADEAGEDAPSAAAADEKKDKD